MEPSSISSCTVVNQLFKLLIRNPLEEKPESSSSRVDFWGNSPIIYEVNFGFYDCVAKACFWHENQPIRSLHL